MVVANEEQSLYPLTCCTCLRKCQAYNDPECTSLPHPDRRACWRTWPLADWAPAESQYRTHLFLFLWIPGRSSRIPHSTGAQISLIKWLSAQNPDSFLDIFEKNHFKRFLKIFKLRVCAYVSSVGLYTSAGVQQKAFEFCELEVQVGVSCPMWILGTNQTWERRESSTCS